MKYVDHRRHSMRNKPGTHLNQRGVDLARAAGEGAFGAVGPYQRVVTSPHERAFETAVAMGFAVDQIAEELRTMPVDAFEDYGWPCDLGTAAKALLGSGPAGRYAQAQVQLIRSIVAGLPEGGAALLVSHGGIVESGAIALSAGADHGSWGAEMSYLEGFRLVFDGEDCVSVTPIRVG